jgi:MSHA pilin protein MshA
MKKQSFGVTLARGFTLIELIVVILILGILGAIAAPRFMDLTSQARASSVNGLRGAVLSAAALANAVQIAQNLTAGAAISVEGQNVTMVNRYPAASATGIELAIRADSTAFQTSAAAGVYTWSAQGTVAGGPCSFTYTAATATIPPVIGNPVTAANC